MGDFIRLALLVWIRPFDSFDSLRDEEVPLAVSAQYGALCALASALLMALFGLPSLFGQMPRAPLALAIALQVVLVPFGFGLVLWVAARVLGSRDASYQQAVSVAAVLTLLYPVALVAQAAAFRVGPGTGFLLGSTLPFVVFVGYASIGLVSTLEANRTAVTILGGLLVLFAGGIGLLTAAAFSAGSGEQDVAQEQQQVLERAIAAQAVAAERAAAAPVAAPAAAPAIPAPPAEWVVDCDTVPPGAQIEDVATHRLLGVTPAKVTFDGATERVTLRFRLGGAERTETVERSGDRIVMVGMPSEP